MNAVPPRAWAHCQIRFVVDSKWEEFQDISRSYLNENGFDMVTVKMRPKRMRAALKHRGPIRIILGRVMLQESVTRTTVRKR